MFQWLKTIFEAKPPKPPAEFRHASLGLLTGEERLWNGQVQQDGRDIPFVVGGTKAAPDARLLEKLLEILAKFPDLETSARRFLCPNDAPVPVRPDDFTFQSIDLLWPEQPDCFTFEFALDGDADAIWRVEFHDGKPKYTGRDS